MPLLLLLGIPALIGGGIAIAANSADNVTEKNTQPIGGGVPSNLPSYITIPLIVGGTILLVKVGAKFIRKI